MNEEKTTLKSIKNKNVGKRLEPSVKAEAVKAELISEDEFAEKNTDASDVDEQTEELSPEDLLTDDLPEGYLSCANEPLDNSDLLDNYTLKALPCGQTSARCLPSLPASKGLKSQDNLQLYLREISRFPLLKPEEELQLARRVRENGDQDAAFRLISSHLRLVVRIAMDFQRRWMQNVLDLIQEGNVGLVRAVSKFDPEKGIKFSYYAAFWIKAYILKFIMDNWRMVKIGTTQAQRKLFYNLNKERQRLIAEGFDPDAATLSKNLNVTEEQIVEMEQRMDATDISLNIPVNANEPGGASRMDYLPALGPGIEETLANSEIASIVLEKLQSLVSKLSDKEQYVLTYRILTDDPVTLRKIGEKYGITRERVRQIEARLLQKVRDHLFSNIKDFSQEWITPH